MPWHARNPSRARLAPPPGFLLPCQPTLAPRPPQGDGWAYELKHDGYRLMAHKAGSGVRLWTRQAVDYTATFPRIAAAFEALPVASCILDGEAVAFGERNYDFDALRTRAGARAAVLIAFDVLEIDGEDLRAWPLEDRRKALEALILPTPPDGLLFSAAIPGDPAAIFEHACHMGFEGVVAKRLGSRYRSGRSPDWLKIKSPAYTRP